MKILKVRVPIVCSICQFRGFQFYSWNGQSFMPDGYTSCQCPSNSFEIVGEPEHLIGIKDINSKETWERDLVKICDDYDQYGMNAGEVYEVYFGYGGFRCKPKYRKEAKGMYLEDGNDYSVIGNCHQNPDLIPEQYKE